ncbi:nucleotidyltransferase family protein [Bacillus sp. DJP31]|uniref:nucleotidyltransferase family protein n=1 Tax=Bacillus sp. DJP31 TaxID=3409789 RepID=UPI003BB6BFD8
MDMDLREQILNDLKSMINETLTTEKVKVYLFGSWARNDEKQSSDIDIAVEAYSEIPSLKWLELQDRVEESLIPYRVDIVNIENASFALIQNIKKEGIVWRDFKND